MSLPTISAFCATYGRHPSFLGEVIESFARQDYEGESELIIFSDDESQDLSYNGPLNVKVVNHRPRITPLAGVFNAAIDMCEGNFDTDGDVDGSDAIIFKAEFGRSPYSNPCTEENPCPADFDQDGDVDGSDALKFKEDFGRSEFDNPCPPCP